MLQRVPPDIKILTPALLFFSKTSTCFPRAAAVPAAQRPAAPPPTMITSQRVCMNDFAIRSARFPIRGYTMCEVLAARVIDRQTKATTQRNSCRQKPQKPKSEAILFPTTRHFHSGRATRCRPLSMRWPSHLSSNSYLLAPWTRPWGCICTYRSAESDASFAISRCSLR